MVRFVAVAGLGLLALAAIPLAMGYDGLWWVAVGLPGALCGLGIHDLLQRRHAVLRCYPIVGHLRFLAEAIRPELQQYFIERNYDGRPFDRDTRTTVYERSKGSKGQESFGTERDVYAEGYESFVHSMAPADVPAEPPRVRIGGRQCTRPYDISLFNISALSFGSLSANAIRAFGAGAAAGGFALDTGEGGLSDYHLESGCDLIWEIGTGYFGCRTEDGGFDAGLFAEKAAHPAVRCVELKLSQGAKPGLGGVLPAAKVNAEIAKARGVPVGQTVVSPPYHRTFRTPRELVGFLARLRELADGKPVGIKLCLGSRQDFLALCKAWREEGTGPDFIVVDGAEGGTGAAPLEFLDHIGTPLTEGLITVHNALRGAGLRDQVRVGASGKVATGTDVVKRLIQGADYTNAGRAMMLAAGCIQAQRCHTNTCPTGVTTQDPHRARALHVGDKSVRVHQLHAGTVASALEIMAALGATGPCQLRPEMLRRRTSTHVVQSYAEAYDWLDEGELLDEPRPSWRHVWQAADPDAFAT